MLDLGLARRPLLEPNLNASGLLCLSLGMLGLLLAETVSLPVEDGAARNPAEPSGREDRSAAAPGNANAAVQQVIQIAKEIAPLPSSLKHELPQVIVSRVLASLAHRGAGARPAGDRLAALRAADHGHGDGRVLSAAPLHADGTGRQRPAHPGGPDRRRRVLAPAPGRGRSPDRTGGRLDPRLPGTDRALVRVLPGPRGREVRHRGAGRRDRLAPSWATGAGWETGRAPSGPAASPRSVCLPQFEPRSTGSFWVSIDSSFRLPVLIAYLALVIIFTHVWPAEKNLAELIALSAALLVASQFWYLDKGGALVMLYLPLAIAMMFRPTLAIRRPLSPAHQRRAQSGLRSILRHDDMLSIDRDRNPASTRRRTPEPMSFQLTYDAIAKRIDHSLLASDAHHCGARGRLPAGGAVRRGQRLHQALRRGAGRADSQGSGVAVGTTVGFPARRSCHGGEGLSKPSEPWPTARPSSTWSSTSARRSAASGTRSRPTSPRSPRPPTTAERS